ncbi:DUF6603 domain-containing protein [Cryptosporangium phraense]|uniref:DUF6603 domain-containing protein n=1 Tax=Cryptosporangium phraense TaxID=2593070 RepID=A0A545AF44_9ACTN|nr:DUF6603 domain-containing protein [Cryptosporangium phraense]TQS39952.1 hypothetical protein FL583_37350 [Cryptosporangium phraense]
MDLDSRSLADVATQLKAQLNGSGDLPLTAGVLGTGGPLNQFLPTVPGGQIVLRQPRFDVAATSWPQTLTVTGPVTAVWPVSALAPDALTVQTSTVTITRDHVGAAATVAFSVDGTVQVDTLRLSVTGVLGADALLRCSLGTGTHALPGLPELVNLVSNGALPITLPSGLPFLQSLKLRELDLLVGFGTATQTSLLVGLDASLDWPIVDPDFVLKSIRATLTAAHRAATSTLSVGAELDASVVIGRQFDLSLQLGGPVWTLDLKPASGVLPSLADLAGLIGGASLQSSVQSGTTAVGLGEIGIDDVRISFDPFGGTLQRILIAGHVVLADVRVDLVTALPDFALAGGLAFGETIHLKALFEHFFGTASGFPDVVVTEFAFHGQPSTGSYGLEIVADDDDLAIGPIGLRSVSIVVEKSSAGVTGAVAADVVIGGVDLVIEASHPEEDGPWVFAGATSSEQTIAIKDMHAALSAQFGAFALPTVIEDLVITAVRVGFDTAGNVSVELGTRFPLNATTSVDLTVSVDVVLRDNSPSDVVLSAKMMVGDLHFEIDFARTQTGLSLLAAYAAKPGATARKVSDLLAPVLNAKPGLAALVPDSLRIELKDVLLYVQRPAGTGPTRFLFGLDLGASIDLAQLPLVGKELPAAQSASVEDLQILVASQAFGVTDVGTVNSLMPAGVTRLPAADLPQGVTFGAKLVLGGVPAPLTLPATPSGTPAPTGQTVGGQPVVQADSTKWITLQKTFGPLQLNRVGFQYAQQKIWFLLDAGISLGGLTFSLDGLAVGSSIVGFSPEFDLRGLGLAFTSGPLALSGALLRERLVGDDGQPYDEYEGAAQLTVRELTIRAIGSYAYAGGYPSLFVYAVLDYPLGGPSFFFVTGLAAGFGYNRRLRIPAIDGVAQFPLVSEAVNPPTGPPAPPLDELKKLRSTIVPAAGEDFLAVGIRFTSFRQIDSFALLTVLFGARFEVDVLGLSTMKLPTAPGATPLAEVQMAVKASVIPDEGFLGVQAQLTSASYLFSRDCHLTGGFAFFSWFSGPHGGDFVVTVGGYRSGYNPPAHYPRVPRVGFNWQVTSQLMVKGEVYFALLPTALMAGGQLQATWNSGNLSAWFTAGFDVLVAWQPYHYEANFHIGIGVRYTYHFFGTHTLSVDVGANLSIWGPDFSGRAKVKLSIVSFEISFGAGVSATPGPLGWAQFQKAFLPDDTDRAPICSLTVRTGLTRSGDGTIDWVLDPKSFTLVSDSAVPAKHYDVAAGAVGAATLNTAFGVAPMDLAAGKVDSAHVVRITRDNVDVTRLFTFSPIRKKVPAAMWGQSVRARTDGDALIADTLAGFAIAPLAPVIPAAETPEILLVADAQYGLSQVTGAFGWTAGRTFAAANRQGDAAVAAALGSTAARAALLAELGLGTDGLTSGPGTATAFPLPPQVGDLLGHLEATG